MLNFYRLTLITISLLLTFPSIAMDLESTLKKGDFRGHGGYDDAYKTLWHGNSMEAFELKNQKNTNNNNNNNNLFTQIIRTPVGNPVYQIIENQPAELLPQRTQLMIELVPRTCWFTNVRSNVSKYYWDKLRKECLNKSNHQCEICQSTKGALKTLHCHEVWDYNDELKIQKLLGLITLCSDCHQVKHAGLAELKGKMYKVKLRLADVNNWTSREVDNHIETSFLKFEERSKHQWRLDISFIENQGIPLKKQNEEGKIIPKNGCSLEFEQAIKEKNIDKVKSLLLKYSEEEIKKFDSDNKNKQNPLHFAVTSGDVNFFRELLNLPQMITFVNFPDKYRQTPIFYAVKEKKIEMVKLLLKRGANVIQVSSHKKNLLHYAITNKDVDCIKILLEHGATALCHSYDDWDKLPLHSTCKIDIMNIEEFSVDKVDKKTVEICSLLIPWLTRAEITKIDKYQKTLLHYVVSVLSEEYLQHLLNNGALEVMEVVDKYGKTALHEAAKWGNIAAVRLILKYCSKDFVNKMDFYGKSALHEAAIYGRIEIIQILLQNGAEFEKKSTSGGLTAFEEARDKFGITTAFNMFSPYMNKTQEEKKEYLNQLQRLSQPGLFSNSVLEHRSKSSGFFQSPEARRAINSEDNRKKSNTWHYSNKVKNFTKLSEILPWMVNTKLPSQTTVDEEGHWIYGLKNMGFEPCNTEIVGKWMLYCSSSEVDAAWNVVQQGIQSGNLYNAKVSANNGTDRHVIIVYTLDYTNIDDVIRVHDYLNDCLGFTNNIFYKTDNQTRAGIYSATSSEPAWTYSSKTIEQYRRKRKLEPLNKSDYNISMAPGQNFFQSIKNEENANNETMDQSRFGKRFKQTGDLIFLEDQNFDYSENFNEAIEKTNQSL